MNLISQKPHLQKVLKSISIQNTGFRHFAEQYLQHLSANDLNILKLTTIKELLDDGWSFLQSWNQTSPKVSIRNLSMLKGSAERGTIIQLLLKNIPFAADSIITEIRRQGYDINFILRGTFAITRTRDILEDIHMNNASSNEMLLHIELRQQVDLHALELLEKDLLDVIQAIELAVEDFLPMKNILEETQTQLLINSKQDEAIFIEWLLRDHFIFLGVTEISQAVTTHSLGIFRQPNMYTEILNQLRFTANQRSNCLWIHKSSFITKIDRYEPLDIVRIQISRTKEIMLIGILTYAAKSIPFNQIPYVTNKLNSVLEHFNTHGGYHDPKEIEMTINQLPFTEVMNLSVEELSNVCKGILSHQSKYVVLVHHRIDPILKQISLMIFIHHEKLTDSNREAVKKILSQTLHSPILHYEADYVDNDLICLYAILNSSNNIPDDILTLPEKISAITLSWDDQLRTSLIDICGAVEGEILSRKYRKIFDLDYQTKYSPETAANDVLKIAALINHSENINVEIYGEIDKPTGQQFQLKLLTANMQIALFDLFTMLNSLELKLIAESSFHITSPSLEKEYWIHDLTVESNIKLSLNQVAEPFKELIQKILFNEISNDSLNTLVLREGLNSRQISLIKAFLSYLKQIQFPLGGKYNRHILIRNSALTSLVIQLFETKFSPSFQDDQRLEAITFLNTLFEKGLTELNTEDEDKLFRHLYNLVTYILRTNYFVRDAEGNLKPYISLKIDNSNILDIPLPAPMAEIFVYAKEFEAVHLRSGKVSRGGIRWSDRGEDYRVEVLSLVKAQNTKNAVIVPMGSKGGFYIKKASPSQTDAVECYKNMMRAMLDITDNLVDGQIIHPKQVIKYDGNDPYLVVAADKGTASFSDIANSISAEYNFWLQDAFASGGSAGYDHKKMAITSRGAWESVKQHFKEVLNIDPEHHSITVVGIGDMSGDVFGNGLLRSQTIQLKAAFNHQHIFIDPNPDISTSFKERERLFNLPRSNWADYSAALMSEGGMIIDRSSKTVTLSPEAKEFLGIKQDVVRPNEIIRAILKVEVDLIWLGGIGTYIKASTESNDAVADRTNDSVRVDGQEVRAKIIAEGANLGCTQKGRIEYALTRKGRINTDFIDNSGGVDCSDHEVNIKILLNRAVDHNTLSLEDRNVLLKKMTNVIGASVTSENILQNLALSYAEHTSVTLLDEYSALIRYLSLHAGLNTKIEFLPAHAELNERQKLHHGLTRPELAVLMAYTKNHLKSQILKLNLLDDDCFNVYLEGYFPSDLHIYKKQMQEHPLKREIIATKLTSQIIDRLGIHFIHRLLHQTGKSISQILRSFIIIRNFFNLETIWHNFDVNLHKLNLQERIHFIHSISDAVYNGCAWLLTFSTSDLNMDTYTDKLVSIFNPIKTFNLLLLTSTECVIPSDKNVNLNTYIDEIQQRLTAVYISTAGETLAPEQLKLFQEVFNKTSITFNLDALKQILKNSPPTNFWGHLFVLSTQLELEYLHVCLTKTMAISILAGKTTYEDVINTSNANIEWLSHMIQQLMASTVYDPAAVTVIMRHLSSLTTSIIQQEGYGK